MTPVGSDHLSFPAPAGQAPDCSPATPVSPSQHARLEGTRRSPQSLSSCVLDEVQERRKAASRSKWDIVAGASLRRESEETEGEVREEAHRRGLVPEVCEASETTSLVVSDDMLGERPSGRDPKQQETGPVRDGLISAGGLKKGGGRPAAAASTPSDSVTSDPRKVWTDESAVSGDEERSILQLAERALASLYDTHDNFFSPEKDEKQRLLKAMAEEVMEILSRAKGVHDIHDRARLSYIRGRALDAFSEFDPEAEKCLARSVKLHPSEPAGWDALGHCYWKKPDLFAARRCFLQALDKGRKADSLRQLSMLLRQLPGTTDETNEYLQESLRLAKEAVTVDVGSGDSWYVLGNAYVASFFRSSRGFKDLDRALQAYKKALVTTEPIPVSLSRMDQYGMRWMLQGRNNGFM